MEIDTSKYLVINLANDEIVNGFYHIEDATDCKNAGVGLVIYKRLSEEQEQC